MTSREDAFSNRSRGWRIRLTGNSGAAWCGSIKETSAGPGNHRGVTYKRNMDIINK